MPLAGAADRMHRYLRAIEARHGVPRLVAWGASFERRFLAKEPWGLEEWSCLLRQAKRAFPDADNHRLSSLAPALGINPGRSHRAMDDARTAAEVMLLAQARERTHSGAEGNPAG